MYGSIINWLINWYILRVYKECLQVSGRLNVLIHIIYLFIYIYIYIFKLGKETRRRFGVERTLLVRKSSDASKPLCSRSCSIMRTHKVFQTSAEVLNSTCQVYLTSYYERDALSVFNRQLHWWNGPGNASVERNVWLSLELLSLFRCHNYCHVYWTIAIMLDYKWLQLYCYLSSFVPVIVLFLFAY